MKLKEARSPAERRMLGTFLQRQIEDVYSNGVYPNNGGGSWQESLAAIRMACGNG